MKKNKQGVTMFVILTVLGLILATGVSVATISIHNKNNTLKEVDQVQKQESAADERELSNVKADLTTVSPPVETSIQNPINTTITGVPSVVAKTVAVGDRIDPEPKVVQICKDVMDMSQSADKDVNTLIEGVINRCNTIATQGLFYSSRNKLQEELKFDWKSIQYKLKTGPTIIEVSVNQPQINEVKVDESPKESYKESSTYPIIISFTDNHGNLVKRSDYNGYEGPYTNMKKIELKVGDVIRATVEARDSQGRTLEYNWGSNSKPFMDDIGLEKGNYKYTSNNHIQYTLTSEDLKSTGEKFRLVYQVRVKGADHYRFGGGEYDDVGFVDYQLAQ